MGLSILHNEEGGWVSPFVLYLVVLKALGNWVHLPSQLEGELGEVREKLNPCIGSWQRRFSFDSHKEFFFNVVEMDPHQDISADRDC